MKLVRSIPWVLSAVVLAIGVAPAEGAPASRGVATFVHGPHQVAPGGNLPLVLVVYGFSTVTEGAPLPRAEVEIAWAQLNVEAQDVAQKPVRATTDAQGAARVDVPAPHGPGPWTLLVHTTAEGKERTDEIVVQKSAAESIRVSPSTKSARAGEAVHAWAAVTSGLRPVASQPVRFDVLEGDVPVQSVWRTTDASGRADAELQLPKGDALVSGWTLAATTQDQGNTATTHVDLEDDTPTEASITLDAPEKVPGAGAPIEVVGHVTDPTGNPVQNTDIEWWGGPQNLAVPLDDARWKKLALHTKTDPSGTFRLQATVPAVIGRAGLTWLSRAATTVGGERIHQDLTTVIGRSTHHLRLLPPGPGLLPGFRSVLVLTCDDDHGRPVSADFRLEGDGLHQTVHANERGEALVTWDVPKGVGTTRQVEPCSGGVAANVTVLAEASARAAGFPARTDLCLPVDRESRFRVVVDPPVVRAGLPVRVEVQEAGKPSTRSFSIVATDDRHGSARTALAKGSASLSTEGLEAGSYTLSALGVSPGASGSSPVVGSFLVVPARLPKPTAKLTTTKHAPHGRAGIDVKLVDDQGRPFGGSVGAIVTERSLDSQQETRSLDVRARYCSRDGTRASLRCDDAVLADSERMQIAPAYLAELRTEAVTAQQDPLPTAKQDAKETFADVVRSLEGAVFEASGSRETLVDVLRKQNGKNGFNPELLTLAVQALETPPETPGGQPVALADLVALDPQVDFDHVARRVARYKLFKLLLTLRGQKAARDPDDFAFEDPNAWLRRLLRDESIEESALLDPWGGTMAFVKGPGSASFLTPKRGFELHAPGPDGKLGTADDVKGPFERVLRSGTPYAVATNEDGVVDAQFQVEVAQTSVDAWDAVIEAATGSSLGLQESGSGFGNGGGGLHGEHVAHGASVRQGHTRTTSGSGFRAIVAPRSVAADGSAHLEVPLGGAEGTYRVMVVADVPGLGRLVEAVDVPVVLPQSLHVKSGARWTVGDRGDVSLVVQNREDTPATLDVLAESSSSSLVLVGRRSVRVTVPAHGQVRTTLPLTATKPGSASVQIALKSGNQLVDRVIDTWQVEPAGEAVRLARAAWVKDHATLDVPHASGHTALGAPVLTLELGAGEALRKALLSVEPARLRDRGQALDAHVLALAVHHWADANQAPALGTLAESIDRLATGRLQILPTEEATSPLGPRDGCPSIPLDRVLKDDPVGREIDKNGAAYAKAQATAQCYDTQVNQRVEQLLKDGDSLELARAIIDLAEHEARQPLSVALTLALRSRVRLAADGRITPPERTDHAGRALILAALVRTASAESSTSRTSPAVLLPWLLVEQDAHGSFGSVEATSAAGRALVANPVPMPDHTSVEVKLDGHWKTFELTRPLHLPLGPRAEDVRIKVHGAPVLARLESQTLRSFQAAPLPGLSAPEVYVEWPTGAKVGQDARLSIRVAPRQTSRAAELRIPLPPNVELAAKPAEHIRLVDHVLRIPLPKAGFAGQITLRPTDAGQFLAPEGGLYDAGERTVVVPARTFVVR